MRSAKRLLLAAHTQAHAADAMTITGRHDTVNESIKRAAHDHRAYTSSLMALYNLSGAPILRHHVEAKTDQDRVSSVVRSGIIFDESTPLHNGDSNVD